MRRPTRTGKFLYGILGGTCVIKPVGSISYRIGGSFDSFITRALADNTIEDFVIDLTETEYIDSTNLGLLARIQAYSVDKLAKRPTVISPNETVKAILANLGFDRLFTIVDRAGMPAPEFRDATVGGEDAEALGDVLLSAHKYLMKTNAKNAVAFREIVELLEKDVRGGRLAR
jgi:anti-anti-sigma factor